MLLKIGRKVANRMLVPFGYTLSPIAVQKGPAQPPSGSKPFYVLSESCQISGLATIYEKFFGERTDGTFVEIGAFDGESHSNTSCLADLGWTGHYVEPVPEFYQKCRGRHQHNANTAVYNLGIGKEEGEIEIHIGGALSTANQGYLSAVRGLERGERNFRQEKTVKTKQITLNAFLEKIDVAKVFDLLVVDVEGLEPDVFSGFDLQAWRPLMMIVELSDLKGDLPHAHHEYAQLFDHILSQGYFVVLKDSINTVFVTSEHYRRVQGLD